MKPRSGVATSETILSAAKIGLEGKLDAYERILTGRHWLAGYNMTLADLYHLPLGQKLIDAGHGAALMDAKRPHVAKYVLAISLFWKCTLMYPFGKDGGKHCQNDQLGKKSLAMLMRGRKRRLNAKIKKQKRQPPRRSRACISVL